MTKLLRECRLVTTYSFSFRSLRWNSLINHYPEVEKERKEGRKGKKGRRPALKQRHMCIPVAQRAVEQNLSSFSFHL